MKELIHKTLNRAGIHSSRTRNITKHILLSFLYKGGSILCNFLLVPLTMDYLDTNNYGIWLTLSSFIGWFSFFDIGLGNGLRNKFTESRAQGDLSLAQAYVSSAYFTIGSICFGLIVLFTAANFFIDWTVVFNTGPGLREELSILMPVVFTFFCLQLVVKLITTIYTADQHHSIQGTINFITQAVSLAAVWMLTRTTNSTLLVFGIVYSALPILLLVIFNLLAFSRTYKAIRPRFSLWKKAYVKDIFGLGMLFFLIQTSGIILYSTDNFIISSLFSPAEVVPYSLAYKYLSIITMLFSIISAPYWSGITDAYYKNDSGWITTSMRSLNRLVVLFSLILAGMVLLSGVFYDFWVGPGISIPFSLTLLMGVFFLFSLIITPYTLFLNGTGKIRIQAFQSIGAALLNIPLSIVLAKYCHLGVEGVILSTVLCFIPGMVLGPVQYRKIIRKKATGAWNS